MMNALVLENGKLRYRVRHPRPVVGIGEVLIRVSLAGICSTDLEIVKGYGALGGVLGHEFVGVVAEIGPEVDAGWLGKRVVGTINVGCQTCAVCLGSGAEHCPRRTVLGIMGRDGVFADFVALPVVNLLEVPDNVPDEAAVFTEPLAAALRIRDQLRIRPDDRIAVVGPGRLGLLIGLVLAVDGGDVTMLGRQMKSLELPADLGLRTALVDQQPDNSFDMVVEATGNEAGLTHSLRLLRPQGTMVLKSTFVGEPAIDLTKLVVAELTVVGSRCGPFAPALRLLASGAIPTARFVDARFALADGLAAMRMAAKPGVRKVLLDPAGSA